MQHGRKFSTSNEIENGGNTIMTIPRSMLSAIALMLKDRFLILNFLVRLKSEDI